MQDSIFTKIIRGDIPSYKVYEDAWTYAFLDIHPKQPGHTLVVPKSQVSFVWDMSPEDYQRLMESARKVGQHLQAVLRPPHVGMMIEGLGVPHAHVHVFPFETTADFHKQSDLNTEPDNAALASMAERIRMEDDL